MLPKLISPGTAATALLELIKTKKRIQPPFAAASGGAGRAVPKEARPRLCTAN